MDLNIEALSDDDLRWADVVMLGGMIVQRNSLHSVLNRCKNINVRTVVGGPYVTALPGEIVDADHLVIGEGENLVPTLATDLAKGCARKRYQEIEKPDLSLSPLPRYELLKPNCYQQMALQFSRGCPFDCEFCDIIVMYGRKVRTKATSQIIAELEAIRATGFSGDVFFVDDNFSGHKKAVKTLLPEIAAWRRQIRAPFEFYTQASLNIADDPALVELMTQAGFNKAFIGIETASKEALRESGKMQNLKGDMIERIHSLLERGIDVAGGFILGFDNENEDIFDRMIKFVEQSEISYAMVGLLVALPNTALYHRLRREGRLRSDICGDQFGLTNVVTKMEPGQLLAGYRHVLESLYDPEAYFRRCRKYLTRWQPVPGSRRPLQAQDLVTVLRFLWAQGIKSSYRSAYWKFLFWALRHQRSKISYAIHQAAAGHHFIKYTQEVVIPSLMREEQSLSIPSSPAEPSDGHSMSN